MRGHEMGPEEFESLLFEVWLIKTFRQMRGDSSPKSEGPCLKEGDIAVILESYVSPEKWEFLSKHLASCETCVDRLKHGFRVKEALKSELETPPHLVERTKRAIHKLLDSRK